jgi:hypothetical protein
VKQWMMVMVWDGGRGRMVMEIELFTASVQLHCLDAIDGIQARCVCAVVALGMRSAAVWNAFVARTSSRLR